ncbi:hypothetical protein F5897_000039 [Canibacter oris]|uniref:Uncharacterized protein n=1 Tax=Canibacter oris TaxID=1365628 RepID=A0A840DGD3_9MICO|nr:hypothetical protein [Canibacter oris]
MLLNYVAAAADIRKLKKLWKMLKVLGGDNKLCFVAAMCVSRTSRCGCAGRHLPPQQSVWRV